MSLSLLQTKFHIPALRPTLVARPRLFAKLNAGINGKLTLLSAAAGFGKTTLICDWLHQMAVPAVWLSLDAADNDLPRFLRYLIGALQRAQPTLGQETLPLLQLPQTLPVDEILTALLNDLTTLTQKLILVLDDYHVIEAPPIHGALSFLVEHGPPQLHLVITSRANPPLPLARWRGRGELTELRAADLRFTDGETTHFFQPFAQAGLTPADLALLTERTEGWIVGLQLAALSLEQQRNVAGFVQNFSGSNRFILDYLLEEVLAQRSVDVQTFLLTTSILERMCGPLCDALLGDTVGRPASLVLPELEGANLFVIALDDERYWYRYHHLFAGVLQQRLRQLMPQRITELHQRASHWFEEQGLLDEAVEYARRAGDLGRVTLLVEQEIRSLIMRGFSDLAKRWLATLPDASIQERPRLLVAQAWLRLFEVPIGDLEAPLRQAEHILAQTTDQPATATSALLAEIMSMRAVEVAISGKAAALSLTQEALRLAGPDNRFVQSIISYALAILDWGRGQWSVVPETFERAIAAAQATGNVIIAASVRYHFAMLQLEHGDFASAEALLAASAAFAYSQPNLWPWPIVDSVQVGRGRLCYERNELAAALPLLQTGIELAQRRRNLYVIIEGYLTLAWVQQALGAEAAAQQALDQAAALVSKATRPGTAELVAAQQARLWLAQGKWEQATQWAQMQTLAANNGLITEHPAHALALAAIDIAQGATTAQGALALLDQMEATAVDWAGRHLQICLLRALALQRLGREAAAQQALQQALTLGKSAGYVRRLVDGGPALLPLLAQLPATVYRDQIMAALAGESSVNVSHKPATTGEVAGRATAKQNLIEPLSERELEVLRLVVNGASNQVIADQLVITVGTVKNHMTSILGKLGVRNRWEAMRKTEELGVLL